MFLKYGLFASGEKGHGMAIKIMINPSINNNVIVLNFFGLVVMRLLTDEPIVITITATVIRMTCSNPKNR